MGAGWLPLNENEGVVPVAAAAAGAPKENDIAGPVEAAGGAAVPNENPVLVEGVEAGAADPNENPPVDASGAADGAEPNEKPPPVAALGAAPPKPLPVLAALPKEKAGAEEAAGAGWEPKENVEGAVEGAPKLNPPPVAAEAVPKLNPPPVDAAFPKVRAAPVPPPPPNAPPLPNEKPDIACGTMKDDGVRRCGQWCDG